MTRALRMLVLALLTVTNISAQTQKPPVQTPPRDPGAPVAAAPKVPAGTGLIAGIVSDESGSRNIANAYVVLIGISTGIVKVTASDAEGRFTFSQLPADAFTVGASKLPYLGTMAGARRPARPGAPVVIGANQRITNVAIRMPMGAAISGIVTNENGEPAQGVQVAAQRWQMQGGARTPASVGRTVATDDRGQYRVHGLPPGEYVIGVTSFASPRPPVLSTADVDAVLRGEAPAASKPAAQPVTGRGAVIYFPGVPRLAEAATILLGAGEERQGADVRLVTIQNARVTAQVMTRDGQPLPGGINVQLRTTAGLALHQWVARPGPDGLAVFPEVPPGQYVMYALAIPSNGQAAFANVEVAGMDVFGVELVLGPVAPIAGTVAFRGAAAPPSLANLRVPIRVIDANLSQLAPSVSFTNPNGEFSVTNMYPGRYVAGGPISFGPTTDTMAWALESVMVDGRDLTDLPIAIGGDDTPKSIALTYTDVFQELSGRIARSNGAPVSDYAIVIFPEDNRYWVWQSRRIVVARPGNDGRFTLSGRGLTTLPPGRYLMAAVADIDRDEQYDPAFLGAISPAAVSVVLKAGEKKVQDIVVR